MNISKINDKMNYLLFKLFDVIKFIIMLMCIIAYRIHKYLFISLGSILTLMSIFSKNIVIIIISFVIGNFVGLLLGLLYSTYLKIINKQYTVVQIRKISHVMYTRINKFGSKSEILDLYKKDLDQIVKDYNKPGSYIIANTQTLFVTEIIRAFLGSKDDEDVVINKLNKFNDDFMHASYNTLKIYESDDSSVEITVLYRRNTISTNNALYKYKKWSELKEASKSVPHFHVRVEIS